VPKFLLCWIRRLSKCSQDSCASTSTLLQHCLESTKQDTTCETSVFQLVLPDVEVLEALAKQLCCLCWWYSAALCHAGRRISTDSRNTVLHMCLNVCRKHSLACQHPDRLWRLQQRQSMLDSC
jgi:hypothetical protein